MSENIHNTPPSDNVRVAFAHSKLDGISGFLVDLASGLRGYSHTEIILPNGEWWSARVDGGVQPWGRDYYDPKWRIYDVGVPDKVDALEAFFRQEQGSPYDYWGVARFVLPGMKQHPDAYFCSELDVAGMQLCGYWPDAVPWKESPNDFENWCDLAGFTLLRA